MKPKIHPPLIERITADEKNKKDPLKAAKTRLHQIFGAYSQVNSLKKANALLEKNMYTDILNLHASTKERLPYVKNFYEFVAQHTGAFNSVLDLGCGFNPFCIPLMPEEFAMGIKTYHAYDIDIRTRE
ncbi:MAG: hypothetical protein LBI27_03175, partial [Clostridiales bacterium]|nr:hypothetical protein [Clostridiales bacterium]